MLDPGGGSSVLRQPKDFQGEARKQRLQLDDVVVRPTSPRHCHRGITPTTKPRRGSCTPSEAPTLGPSWAWPSQGGRVIRPMLGLNRSDILHWPRQDGWDWREDASNASSKYLRNRIRHELLPLLEDIKPGSIAHLQRLGRPRTRPSWPLLCANAGRGPRRAEGPAGSWSLKA